MTCPARRPVHLADTLCLDAPLPPQYDPPWAGGAFADAGNTHDGQERQKSHNIDGPKVADL